MTHRTDYAFMFAAFVSLMLSLYLWFAGQRADGLFVGIWVPSILALALLQNAIARQPPPRD